MNKINPNVHPQISKTIKNLNVDAESELDKYEQSLNNTNLIPQSSGDNFQQANNIPVVYQSASIEEEIISVNSQNVESSRSLIEKILTGWGIFGILIFIATNIVIVVFLQTYSNSNNQQQSQPENIEKVPNQNLENNQNNLNSPNNIPAEKNKSSEQSPQSSQKLNQTDNKKTTKQNNPNNNNQTSPSPYNNLTTALFTESNQSTNNIQTVSTSRSQTTPINNSNTQAPVKVNSENVKPQTVAKNNIQTQGDKTPANNQQEKFKYYVISNYKGMEEFSAIQEKVPSALITNIEKEMKIQLAVFDQENQATNKIKQFANQGIQTYIHRQPLTQK